MAAAIKPIEIFPSDIKAVLRTMLLAGTAAFLWGPPGVGKSEITLELANELGIAFCDVRLSQREPTDVRGVPVPVKENGETVGVVWIAPSEFPLDIDQTFYRDVEAIDQTISFKRLNPLATNGYHHVPNPQVTARSLDRKLEAIVANVGPTEFTVQLVDKVAAEAVRAAGGGVTELLALEAHAGRIEYRVQGEARAILAFEEMNSAQPTVLAACYQIINDRIVADMRLNDHILMCAMGNREDDRGVAFKMPEPLLNRMFHYNVTHSAKDWLHWALDAQQDASVIAFLQRFEDKLFDHKPGSGAKGFATPRSWTRVSKVLKTLLDNPALVLSEKQLRATVYGGVGDGVGAEFFEFRKIGEKLPTADDVLSGRVTHLTEVHDDRTAIGYLMTNSLLFSLRNEDADLQQRGIDETSTNKERKDWYGKVDNYIQFAISNFKPDVNIMGVRTALQTHNLPISGMYCKSWPAFVKKYRDAMIDM